MMRKKPVLILLAFFLILPIVSSTQINSEKVNVDIGSSSKQNVEVELSYKELTQTQISYLVPYSISNVKAYSHNKTLDCKANKEDIGTEIICNTIDRRNFSVRITYETKALVEDKGNVLKFSYSHNILDPTELYKLKVVLPEGTGIYRSDREDINPIIPETDSIGSTGRRIYVEWENNDVELGDQVSYSLYIEELKNFPGFPYLEFIAAAGTILTIVFVSYFYFRSEKKTISAIMPVLKEGEREILKLIIDEGKECKQKEIVDKVDFSKAKVSRILKDLEERNLISKEKKGRKNYIKIKREIGDINT